MTVDAAQTWTFDVTRMPDDASLDQYSDPAQRKRQARLVTPWLRRVAAASVAAQVVAVRVASGRDDLEIRRTCVTCGGRDHGAPRTNDPELWLSASHSGDIVEIATWSRPVGVDVERRTDASRDVPYLALTDEEVSWVSSRSQEERTDAFLWLWVRKEAVLKMLGVGLLEEPDAIDVRQSGVTIRGEPMRWQGLDVRLYSYLPREGYVAAVAGPGLHRCDAVAHAEEHFARRG